MRNPSRLWSAFGCLALLCASPTNVQSMPPVAGVAPQPGLIAASATRKETADATTQAPVPRESGIEGRITIGPSTPVAQAGEPNTRPYQTTISVLDANGREVTRFKTDADGRFRVLLEPGTYRLRPEARGPYPRASEKVTVTAGTLTHVDIGVDSGIRGLQQRE